MDTASTGTLSDGIRVEEHLTQRDSIPAFHETLTAFLGRTQRGPVNQATEIGSHKEFERIFGGPMPGSYLHGVVADYFVTGGQAATIVRVVNRATRNTISLPAGNALLTLEAINPGSFETLRSSVDYDELKDDSSRFNLVVQRLAAPGSPVVLDQEIYTNVSTDPAARRYLPDVLMASMLVRVRGRLPAQRPARTVLTSPGEPIAYRGDNRDGDDGEALTDYDLIGSGTDQTGLFALQSVERLDLLCVPPDGRHSSPGPTALLASERYCQRRRALLIMDVPPEWGNPQQLVSRLSELRLRSENVMTYYPWLRSPGTFRARGGPRPACGAVAGTLARNDREYGVWHPATGPWRALSGRLALSSEPSAGEMRMLVRHGVNCFKKVSGGFVDLVGNVTLAGRSSPTAEWRSLPVTRLSLLILDRVMRGTRWVVFEENDEATWSKAHRQLDDYFGRLQRAGALAGDDGADAYFIKCDAQTTSSRDVQNNQINILVGFSPLRSGTFLVFRISHRIGYAKATPFPMYQPLALAG